MSSALQFADHAVCAIQGGYCGLRHHISGGKEAEGSILVSCSVFEVVCDEAMEGHALASPAIS